MLFEIIFLSFGILLIVSAAANILRNMRIKKKGILVSATVVDIHRTSRAGKNKSRMQYHPVFEYRTDGGPVKTRGPGAAEVKHPSEQYCKFVTTRRGPSRFWSASR